MSIKINEQIHVVLTSLLAFSLPCFKQITPPLIILLGIVCLFNFRNGKNIEKLLKNTGLLFMSSLYLVYLIGLLYSTNLSFGKEVIETKLSLLVLPFIYVFYSDVTKKYLDKYLYFFVAGSAVYALFSIGYALLCFYRPFSFDFPHSKFNLGVNYFYYTNLSRFLHPSYSSMYSSTSILAILYFTHSGKLKSKWLGFLLVSFFTVYILLLSSRAGWFVLAILMGVLIYQLIKAKYTLLGLSILCVLFGMFTYFNISNTTNFSGRIPVGKDVFNAIKGKNESNEAILSGKDGTVSRILVWKTSASLFLNHFIFGVGTGDSKDELMREYKKRGMTRELETELNSHNQYLTVAVSLGIIGLLIFGVMLLYPFLLRRSGEFYFFSLFMMIVTVNLFFESMFETQAGIVYFSFFYTIFCIVSTHDSRLESYKTVS
jgi:O-antigen ligase